MYQSYSPMPLLDDSIHQGMVTFLSTKARALLSLSPDSPSRPKAIVLVTAHWEASVPTISSNASPELYYDYYNFPKEAYSIKYPAPGSPEIAKRAQNLLKSAGFASKLDAQRGWDHGVFVPLKLLHPDADIPIIQVSVLSSQDPKDHIKMGEALTPLRDEGVMIVGSGMTFHSMKELRKGFGASTKSISNRKFDDRLTEVCAIADLKERGEKLAEWEEWEQARFSHPEGRAEHFMPLLVAAGAGGNVTGEKILSWQAFGVELSAYLWN